MKVSTVHTLHAALTCILSSISVTSGRFDRLSFKPFFLTLSFISVTVQLLTVVVIFSNIFPLNATTAHRQQQDEVLTMKFFFSLLSFCHFCKRIVFTNGAQQAGLCSNLETLILQTVRSHKRTPAHAEVVFIKMIQVCAAQCLLNQNTAQANLMGKSDSKRFRRRVQKTFCNT